MDANLTYRNIDLDTTEVQAVTGPCRLFGFQVMNQNPDDNLYVHFYDALIANVTVGDTVPKLTYMIPPGGGLNFVMAPGGVRFDTGIAVAGCTNISSSESDPGANELIICLQYQQP